MRSTSEDYQQAPATEERIRRWGEAVLGLDPVAARTLAEDPAAHRRALQEWIDARNIKVSADDPALPVDPCTTNDYAALHDVTPLTVKRWLKKAGHPPAALTGLRRAVGKGPAPDIRSLAATEQRLAPAAARPTGDPRAVTAEEHLTLNAIARRTGIHPDTLRAAAAGGHLPAPGPGGLYPARRTIEAFNKRPR